MPPGPLRQPGESAAGVGPLLLRLLCAHLPIPLGRAAAERGRRQRNGGGGRGGGRRGGFGCLQRVGVGAGGKANSTLPPMLGLSIPNLQILLVPTACLHPALPTTLILPPYTTCPYLPPLTHPHICTFKHYLLVPSAYIHPTLPSHTYLMPPLCTYPISTSYLHLTPTTYPKLLPASPPLLLPLPFLSLAQRCPFTCAASSSLSPPSPSSSLKSQASAPSSPTPPPPDTLAQADACSWMSPVKPMGGEGRGGGGRRSGCRPQEATGWRVAGSYEKAR